MLGRSPPLGRTALARTPPHSCPSSPVRHRLRSATTRLAAADHYANLGREDHVASPRRPPQPSSLNFASAASGSVSGEAKEDDPFQVLLLEMARLRKESATLRQESANHQELLALLVARLHASPVPAAPAPSASSKSPTLVQAIHSCLNGTPGQLPPIARHTDIGSRLLALEPGISSHAIEFRICKPILKYIAEAKYGRQRGGLQLTHIALVARAERLDPSVTQAPEVQLPLGDGQHLSMAIVESKSDGKDQPKSLPLTGLLDLRLRTEALVRALHFLYSDAAAVSLPLLLPQALDAVATALAAATKELGPYHAAYATHLAEVIEGGIARYFYALNGVANQICNHPTLVHVHSLPPCVHFDALLADLRNPDELEYQASQWAHRSPPRSIPPAASSTAPPAGSGAPGASSTGTFAPPGGRRLPQGFAANHMPIDTAHKDQARFCFRHLQGQRCEASKCKYSHGVLPANAFSNEALLALLKGGN